eukprot:137659-Chlamydomonas_euryale.AAC.1
MRASRLERRRRSARCCRPPRALASRQAAAAAVDRRGRRWPPLPWAPTWPVACACIPTRLQSRQR